MTCDVLTLTSFTFTVVWSAPTRQHCARTSILSSFANLKAYHYPENLAFAPLCHTCASRNHAGSMPAMLLQDTPRSPRSTPATFPVDWELAWILITVAGLLVLELTLVLTCIRCHNLRSKARWRRLRERGVVVVSGPALLWVGDLPIRNQISYFNLRQAAASSRQALVYETV